LPLTILPDITLASTIAPSNWLILIFFPMAWSFICPTEIASFSSRLPDFTARAATLAFASCDSEHVLKAWNATPREEGGLGSVGVPLLSDRSGRLARDYGVFVEEEGISRRALFVVDPRGVIRATSVNDVAVGRSVEEVLRVLDALRFADEFGEGCPADWKVGDQGIKMDGGEMGWREVEGSHEVVNVGVPAKAEGGGGGGVVLKAERPGMAARGSSWSASWGRAARPKTWNAGVRAAKGEEVGRPRSVFWSNEDAVADNGLASV